MIEMHKLQPEYARIVPGRGQNQGGAEAVAQFANFLQQVAGTALPLASQLFPGLAGVGGLGGGALGGLGGLGGGGMFNMDMSDPFANQRMFLELQARVNAQSQAFQATSNIMKAAHDAKMAAVQNMRP